MLINKVKVSLDLVVAFLRGRPLVGMAIFLMSGIFLAAEIPKCFWIGTVLSLVSVIFFIARLINKSHKKRFVFLLLFSMGLGMVLMSLADNTSVPKNHISNYTNTGKVRLQGTIVKPLIVYDDHTVAIVDVDRIIIEHKAYMPVEGLVRLNIKDPRPGLNYGETIRFSTKLKKITSYGVIGVFDYQKFSNRRNIFVTGMVRKSNQIEIIGYLKHFLWGRWIEIARNKIRLFLDSNLSTPHNLIISALLLGDRERIPKSVFDTFQKGGVSHLLAISGMHFGSIFLLAYLLVSRLLKLSSSLCRKWNIYKVSAFVAMFPALIYAELAGWRISATRAFIMVLMYVIALIAGKQRDLLSALAWAAIIILLIWPYSLFEPAFQLSFSAVLAFSLIVPRILKFGLNGSELDKIGPQSRVDLIKKWLKLSLASTFGAVLFTSPITAYHFNSITPYAVFSNLIMIPLYTMVVVPLNLVAIPFIFIKQSFATAIFTLSGFAIDIGYFFTSLIAKIPGSIIWLGRPTWFEIVAYFTLLTSLFYLRKRALKIVVAISMAILIATPAFFFLARQNQDDLKITVIDIGQGLSQLIEFPGGKTWLIDGGGSMSSKYDVGQAVISPLLRAKRIRTLDRVINTHPHPDHFGGLLFIMENFNIKHVTLADLNWDEDDRYRRFKEMADSLGKDRVNIGSSDSADVKINGAKVKWLYPPLIAYKSGSPETSETKWSLNDLSMVIRISYGDCTILLTADIEKLAEEYLVKSGVDLKADVLISPHHGSKTSSTLPFLAAVRAESVVIPVGRYNWYGFPHKDVIQNYNEIGANIYRIDLDQSVEIICDSKKIFIRTFFQADKRP